MRAIGLLVSVLAVACGGGSGGTPDGSAPADSSPRVDAPTGPACDLAAPFGPLQPVSEVNAAVDGWCSRLSADQLALYTSAGVADGSDIVRFTRASIDNAFDVPPVTLTALNIGMTAECALPSADGSSLYYSYDVGGQSDMFVAYRSATGEFTDPQPIEDVNTPDNEWWVWFVPAGFELFFTATRGGVTSIHRAVQPPGYPWEPGALVAELHEDGAEEMGPSLTGDGLTIYFMRNGDILHATRPTLGSPFGPPVIVAELSTPEIEWPTWISPDGCTLYVDAYRAGMSTEADVYMATKPPR